MNYRGNEIVNEEVFSKSVSSGLVGPAPK